ncbi:MAG: hypothetical protein HYV09_06890 [Deltaproteobacteria bacterium]|nr:hypothetical protein [Deltaproteobacteria bacterium]
MHAPATQVSPFAQVFPQVPQLPSSVARCAQYAVVPPSAPASGSVSAPASPLVDAPQSVNGATQSCAHAPPVQT